MVYTPKNSRKNNNTRFRRILHDKRFTGSDGRKYLVSDQK